MLARHTVPASALWPHLSMRLPASTCLLLSAFTVGQTKTSVIPMREGFAYLRPFRTPAKNLQPPLELYDELRQCLAIASNPGAYKVSHDEQGREVCDSPAWKDAHRRAEIKAARMGGYLAVVCQESGSAEDRRLGFYGAYFIDSMQDAIAITSLIPSEPVARIREEAMVRAVQFLKVQMAKKRGGQAGPRPATPVDYSEGRAVGGRVFEDPDAPVYDLDVTPWCALVESGDPREKAQGLWFLREVGTANKQVGALALNFMQTFVRDLVVHEHAEVRKQVWGLLAAADPQGREAPGADAAADAVKSWSEAVLYDLFPPIRLVSAGLVELFPSADLDQIVATGKELLARDGIGATATGTAGGIFYRGFRVNRQPKPLDLLRLPANAVITRINGVPVADSKELLDTIENFVKRKQALVVEFIHQDQTKAIEYRYRG